MGRARCCVWAQIRPLGFYGNVLDIFASKLRSEWEHRQNQTQHESTIFSRFVPTPWFGTFFGDGWFFSKCETVLASQNVQEEVLGILFVNCMKPSEVFGSSSEVLGSPRKSPEVLGSLRRFLGSRAPNSISRLGVQRFQSQCACFLLCCTIIQECWVLRSILGCQCCKTWLTRFQGTR